MTALRPVILWAGVATAIALPLILAGFSPYLAWRQPVYIAAGFAGIAGLGLLLLQPLLARRALPGLSPRQSRHLHRLTGATLVALVLIHVAGLWITSPPDVIDALLFRSPTPFSVWGVLAMWLVFAAGLLALMRRRLRPRLWSLAHRLMVAVIAAGTILHAILIEGTMEPVSKSLLCLLVGLAALSVLFPLRR